MRWEPNFSLRGTCGLGARGIEISGQNERGPLVPQFEYKTEVLTSMVGRDKLRMSDLDAALVKHGKDWELVSVNLDADLKGTRNGHLLFFRPRGGIPTHPLPALAGKSGRAGTTGAPQDLERRPRHFAPPPARRAAQAAQARLAPFAPKRLRLRLRRRHRSRVPKRRAARAAEGGLKGWAQPAWRGAATGTRSAAHVREPPDRRP
jgi:hypothetical protein